MILVRDFVDLGVKRLVTIVVVIVVVMDFISIVIEGIVTIIVMDSIYLMVGVNMQIYEIIEVVYMDMVFEDLPKVIEILIKVPDLRVLVTEVII